MFDIFLTNPWFLITAVVVYILFYFISSFSYLFTSSKNSPLKDDYRRPPEPFVLDPKERAAVIKQKFNPDQVPDNVDTIVIGSGVGGLTTAVLLGRAGQKVLVLEQHGKLGGCCHAFKKKGIEFDTGIHYIGNLHEGSDNKTLLDQLTEGQLRWSKMDDSFDTVVIGDPSNAKLVPMVSGKERYLQNLIDRYPSEEKGIRRYMELVKEANDSFFGIVLLKVLPLTLVKFLVSTGLYRYLFAAYRKKFTETTLQEVLDKITNNEELKLVLSYVCGDYGVFPDEVPFVLHAILINHYFRGGYYPSNGTSEIAFHMCRVIEKLGSSSFVQAPVSKIICDSQGKAIGVTVDGKTPVDIFAKNIVSDAGVVNTFKKLLPPEVATKSYIYPIIEKVGPSCSYITTFVGVEGSVKDLKLPATNFWVYNCKNINKCFTDFLNLKPDEIEDAEIPFGYISFPCAKDSEWDVKYPGKSSILIITLANWEWFKEWKDEKLRHRGDRYEGIKDVVGRKMWQLCVDLFPQLDGKKDYMEVGTPVTNSHYLGYLEGEMYGLNQGPSRFSADVMSKLRCDTDVPGLYLTGQDTMTAGFSAALTMGLVCASKILEQNLFVDLMNLKKKLYPKDESKKSQ